jgi:hypothetical protein
MKRLSLPFLPSGTGRSLKNHAAISAASVRLPSMIDIGQKPDRNPCRPERSRGMCPALNGQTPRDDKTVRPPPLDKVNTESSRSRQDHSNRMLWTSAFFTGT